MTMLSSPRLFLMASIATCVVFTACDPGKNFTYSNETNEDLFVLVNGGSMARVPADRSDTFGYLDSYLERAAGRLELLVVDINGCTVLEMDETVASFREEFDSKLTIDEDDIIPKPQWSSCDAELADIARRTR
jgi:hypothetical protein